MIIHDTIELNITQLDEKHYLYDRFIFIEGMNGIIPELRLWLVCQNDDIEDEILDIQFKSGRLNFKNKGFIYERSKVGDRELELKIYLFPKDMIYKRSSASYKSANEAMNSINTLPKEGIPTLGNYPCNQMLESNSSYLTKLILTAQENFGFYYGLDGKIHGVDLSSESLDLEIRVEDPVKIKEKSLSAKYNPLEDTELLSTDYVTSCSIASNTHRNGSLDASEAYLNYAKNRALFNRHNETIELISVDTGSIEVGWLVKYPLTTKLSKNYRCFMNTIEFINHELSMSSVMKLVNE